MIILGTGAIGKSTLAEKYNGVADIDIVDYKYISHKHVKCNEELKGNSDAKLNSLFPSNYMKDLLQSICSENITLLGIQPFNIEYLTLNSITWFSCIYEESLIPLMKERMLKRGNNLSFVEKVISSYPKHVELAKRTPNQIVLTKELDTLEKYLLKYDYIRKDMLKENVKVSRH